MPANQLVTNYNTQQIFLCNNFFQDKTYTNSTGSTVTLLPGTLLGTVLATNKLLPNISSATDGSEMPMGICADTYVVANGDSAVVTFCTGGDVNENAVVLGSGDTYATVVRTASTGGGTIRDLIGRNTTIQLVASTELSVVDPNQ